MEKGVKWIYGKQRKQKMKLLTKSKYLLGLQCPRLLWIAINNKEQIPKPDKIAQKKFEDGDLIGYLATDNFPKGINLAGLSYVDNIEETKKLVKEKKIIFEAGFEEDNLYSRVDILVPKGDSWDIIEVKSATKVKDVNIHDVSFQKYVLEKAGLRINRCYLMHINNEYVFNNRLESEELFVQTDITDLVTEVSESIEKRIENMLKIINSKKEPKTSIGLYCDNPYECPIKDNCWNEIPEGSVFEFYKMLRKKAFELYDRGLIKIKDIPENIKLNDKQKIQRQLALAPQNVLSGKGKEHIDKLNIKNFLNNLEYPIYYLDFETINPALPKFNGMKPYQRIPFQFSLHIQKKKNGEVKHISFLADGTDEPRTKFLKALKDNLGDKGTILVYNQSFEKGVLKECSNAFPRFKKWYEENIEPRIKDLWEIFRNFYYYNTKQKGSASIKAVLPVMSELNYKELEDVQKGDEASYEWERITFDSGIDKEEKAKIRKALEKYCELDTLAEVEILRRLCGIIEEDENRKI